MSVLGSFRATRTLAKIRLEAGLKQVNDFYWGILASTKFSVDPSAAEQMKAFTTAQPEFRNQGRLRSDNIGTLVGESRLELPKFAVILLFSYFEPYLRSLWLAGILGNPGSVIDTDGVIDGESIASDEHLVAVVSKLSSPIVEDLLKGPYVDRLGKARRQFGIPPDVLSPYVSTLDNYYSKRNCLVHFQGRVSAQSKRYFMSDARNEIGNDLVVEHADFLQLHSTVHSISDELDKFMLENHIRNTEILRLLYQLRKANPNWSAKDFSRELLRQRFSERPGKDQLTTLLNVPKK